MADLTPTPLGDLDAKRIQRAQARAARQEARGETLPIIFGGQVIATLDAEFPLDVLEPLQHVNMDIGLLLQQAVTAASRNTDDSQAANLELIVNILAVNPDLPKEFITAVKEVGRRLLGEQGYAAFIAQRPTPWDVAALTSMVFSWYGTNLGEFWRSSDSPVNGGPTSNSISSSTATVSTPGESGSDLESRDSSESAA